MADIKVCLLVDDDVQDQAIFLKAITDVATATICYTASDGLDALLLLKEENIRPDYIFAELDMPRMNGLQFLKEIKNDKELRDIPVVLHSTSPREDKVALLREEGAFAILFRRYDYQYVRTILKLCDTMTLEPSKQ